jgi:hypothetical protein
MKGVKMDLNINLGLLIGALLSVMLSIIAWFIRQLHQDFRSMQSKVSALFHTSQSIQAESKSAYELLKLQINFLEWRLEEKNSYKQQVKPIKKQQDENSK